MQSPLMLIKYSKVFCLLPSTNGDRGFRLNSTLFQSLSKPHGTGQKYSVAKISRLISTYFGNPQSIQILFSSSHWPSAIPPGCSSAGPPWSPSSRPPGGATSAGPTCPSSQSDTKSLQLPPSAGSSSAVSSPPSSPSQTASESPARVKSAQAAAAAAAAC